MTAGAAEGHIVVGCLYPSSLQHKANRSPFFIFVNPHDIEAEKTVDAIYGRHHYSPGDSTGEPPVRNLVLKRFE